MLIKWPECFKANNLNLGQGQKIDRGNSTGHWLWGICYQERRGLSELYESVLHPDEYAIVEMCLDSSLRPLATQPSETTASARSTRCRTLATYETSTRTPLPT